ncbi:MAG: class I SAM-dependent methyltransferase, partial [Candidatus Omnitrophica bacterium]|nr:class I SAM-dependent methyltransferase [Candidatus Omnitrophota bacterium]
YLARVRAVRKATKKYSGRSLEIGSGISTVTDASVYTDLEWAAMKELRRLEAAGGPGRRHAYAVTHAESISFRPESFDSVILSEVLEHIGDDQKALREMASVLKPEGHLVLTVPMHSYYWAGDDELVHHQRRYEMNELKQKVEAAGFEVVGKMKVGGPLERLGCWLMVKLFLLTSKKTKGGSLESLRKFFPFYKILNELLCVWTRLDAWLMPEFLTSILLVECRKK